jgi:hypothetical protein
VRVTAAFKRLLRFGDVNVTRTPLGCDLRKVVTHCASSAAGTTPGVA